MANALSFEDLVPAAPAKKAPALPSRAPSLPASLRNADPRTARVVPLPAPAPDRAAPYGVGGMVAQAVGAPGFNDLTPQLSPGAEAVRQQVRAQGDKGVAKSVLPPQVLAALNGAGNSMTLGFAGDMAAGLNAGKQGIVNAVAPVFGQRPGPSMADTYAGTRQAYLDEMRNETAQTPLAMAAGQIAGGFRAPGVGKVTEFVSAPSVAAKAIKGTGVLPAAARIAARAGETTAKSALAGAGYGALNGAGNAPDGQRLQGGVQGAETGAVLGAAAPAALKAGEIGLNRIAAPVANGALRIANKASGGQILDPAQRVNQVLAQNLAADFKARGVAPQNIPAAIQQQIQNWRATGSPMPNMMDVAGENTRAAMRTAASQVGPGRTAAQNFADKTASGLQDLALNRTRALTPNDNRPASAVSDALATQRRVGADADYRAPYAAMVDPAPVIDALTGETGARGISKAYTEADAMRLAPQMQELRALRAAANPEAVTAASSSGTPESDPEAEAWAQRLMGGQPLDHDAVSLGTLDRLKVAYNNLGDVAAEKGAGGEASGYYGRAGQIDDYLANLKGPEGGLYRKARDNYANISGHMDAMKAGDINVMNADPDEFGIAMAKLTPDQRAFSQLQLRQNLTNMIGAPPEGAAGTLNRIATSPNSTRNLTAAFGDDTAGDYQGAIKNMVVQNRNAQFVAPNTGPKSANVLLDADAATRPHHLSLDPMDWVMAARRAGMLLTPQESEMLVKAGQAPATTNVPAYNPQTLSLPAGSLTGAVAGGVQPAEDYMPQ